MNIATMIAIAVAGGIVAFVKHFRQTRKHFKEQQQMISELRTEMTQRQEEEEITHEMRAKYAQFKQKQMIEEKDLKDAEEKKDPSSVDYINDNLLKLSSGKTALISTDKTIKNCIIPEGVKKICSFAFEDCKNLEAVTIPESVTTIGYHAFYNCSSLQSIVIPKSVDIIEKEAFNYCRNLQTVTILGNTSIDEFAFSRCSNLVTLVISNRISMIKEYAFSGCDNLESVIVSDDDMDTEGAVFLVEKGYRGIYHNAFHGCYKLKTVSIPGSLSFIGSDAFRNCTNLESVTIHNGVTSIGSGAFSHCTNLASIIIPEGLMRIERDAFFGCTALTSIAIPDNAIIGDCAFYGCTALTSIIIPDSIEYLGFDAFEECPGFSYKNLKDIWVDEFGVVFSADRTKLIRAPKELREYIIPEGTTIIGRKSFANRTLRCILIPDSVKVIEPYAFDIHYKCRLDDIEIPQSVTSIGENAFCGIIRVHYAGNAKGSPWGAEMITNKVRKGEWTWGKVTIQCNPSFEIVYEGGLINGKPDGTGTYYKFSMGGKEVIHDLPPDGTGYGTSYDSNGNLYTGHSYKYFSKLMQYLA